MCSLAWPRAFAQLSSIEAFQFQSLEFDPQPHMAYLHMLDLLVGWSVFKLSSLSWCCTALFSLLTALKAWLGECLSFTLQVGLIDVHVASSVLADVAAFAWPLLHLKLGAAFAGMVVNHVSFIALHVFSALQVVAQVQLLIVALQQHKQAHFTPN